jgi:UDP-N-acetylglucosamine transferase subunit ALG13
MIFVTVGTQGQFDRLIRTVDTWAGSRGRTDVFAQIGQSEYHPIHIQNRPFIDPNKFSRYVEAANLVIAHAGMGSIITALELGKRIIVMPRRADFGEHRSDHQIATAKRLATQGRISVAFNEQELVDALDQFETLADTEQSSVEISPSLIAAIKTFIDLVNREREKERGLDALLCLRHNLPIQNGEDAARVAGNLSGVLHHPKHLSHNDRR